MSDLTRSNRPLNAHCEPSKIIPYVPLQPKIKEVFVRCFYSLMSVFFRLADRLKFIAIFSSGRIHYEDLPTA